MINSSDVFFIKGFTVYSLRIQGFLTDFHAEELLLCAGGTTVEENGYLPNFDIMNIQSKISTKNEHQCFRDFCEEVYHCEFCLETSFTSLLGIFDQGNSRK